ncbi:cytochrome b/b6 domain-containing protein [Frankia sp. AgPm24]|uniref:cytochrome b/b6 domain-containing protein n=1 Tax=Frankia sp. AgPm24 TaxID=631128 RepID=UPI00200F98D0|nr:cytochrome b/b6 domain-containing protein [Frankia sp. AgPm24]MCK9923203.1 cytochrome b/b6 domain-containing protein [Frankia sp. AgPm24]
MTPSEFPVVPTTPGEPAVPSDAGRGGGVASVRRFGRATRLVHWTTAAAMGSCLITGAVLLLPPLAELVGRRRLVETIHLYSGLALPIPMLVAAGAVSYRRDVRALNRFTTSDGAWLRARLRLGAWRRARARGATAGGVGKFNAGQKLYAAFVAGGILVMLGTGVLMQWGPDLPGGLPDAWRTGSTFVHDLLAYGLFFGVAGHLWMAAHDPIARVGIRTGTVPAWWAAREHPAWTTSAARPHRTLDEDTLTDEDDPAVRPGRARSPRG